MIRSHQRRLHLSLSPFPRHCGIRCLFLACTLLKNRKKLRAAEIDVGCCPGGRLHCRYVAQPVYSHVAKHAQAHGRRNSCIPRFDAVSISPPNQILGAFTAVIPNVFVFARFLAISQTAKKNALADGGGSRSETAARVYVCCRSSPLLLFFLPAREKGGVGVFNCSRAKGLRDSGSLYNSSSVHGGSRAVQGFIYFFPAFFASLGTTTNQTSSKCSDVDKVGTTLQERFFTPTLDRIYPLSRVFLISASLSFRDSMYFTSHVGCEVLPREPRVIDIGRNFRASSAARQRRHLIHVCDAVIRFSSPAEQEWCGTRIPECRVCDRGTILRYYPRFVPASKIPAIFEQQTPLHTKT